MNMRSSSFTLSSENRLNVIKTPCHISVAYNPQELKAKNQSYPTPKEYNAIWDTGATGSVISKKVVDELGLHPTGFIPVHHAGGRDISPYYKVNFLDYEIERQYLNYEVIGDIVRIYWDNEDKKELCSGTIKGNTIEIKEINSEGEEKIEIYTLK